jgi:organic hydroperoxide reductase OsmC/OhrA
MADIFRSRLEWTGASKGATADDNFSRDFELSFDAGIRVPVSAAPAYKGDPSRLNPEELLVASLSSCLALTYLALAARKGVAVVAYSDNAEGRRALVDGRLRLSLVTLRPHIVLAGAADEARARELVANAHEQSFVASSTTTKVKIEPVFEVR